jgi:hypothetical protein
MPIVGRTTNQGILGRIKERGCVIIEIPYHFVIQSVAKDFGNTYFMIPRFFASL